jgi:hypothetical protein
MLETIEKNNISRIPKKPYKIKKDSYKAKDPETEEEQKIVSFIKSYIENNVFIWDTLNIEDFKFILPQTVFSDEKKINFQLFEESEIKYDDSYISRSLTSEQLSEIWKTAKFSVKSKDAKSPYIWQISSWLHKGSENITNSFYDDIGQAYAFLYYLKFRFSLQKSNCAYSIPYSFINIFHSTKDLWGILFGRIRYSRNYMDCIKYPESYLDPILFKEYQKNLLKDHPEILTSIFYPKFQRIISKIYQDFLKRWEDESITLEHDLREQEISAKEIKEKLREIKFNRLIEQLEGCNQLDDRRKRYFIDMLKAENIYLKLEFEHQTKIREVISKIKNEIKSCFPIKSRVVPWFNAQVDIRIKPEMEKLENEYDASIEKELSEYPIHKLKIQSYRNYLRYIPQNRELALAKIEKGFLRQYETYKAYRYPFKIIQTPDPKIPNKIYYTLSKYENWITTSDCSFWRVRLFFKRIFAGYNNILVFCYNFCWNNSFGLKALCTKEIIQDYDVNYNTGAIIEEKKTFTYYSSIKYLCESISKSRSDFERAGENGFLSGRLGRFCNLLENYVWKMIFGGIGLVIFYPIAIILLFFINLILTLFGFIFITIWTIIRQLFNIFIFDVDNPNRHGCYMFPIFIIFFYEFLIRGILNFIFSIIAIIGQILLPIFMVIFGSSRWCLRSIYDSLTICLIRCNGHIPKADTSFAWKISGPGSGRSLFYKLEIEEALLLVRSELEKIELEGFSEKLSEEINKPKKIHDEIIDKTLANLNGDITPDQKLNESVRKYESVLNEQVRLRKSIYPHVRGNVRFTRDDLETLLEATFDLIKDFVHTKDLQFIWKMYKLLPNNWRLLTEKILIKTFGSEDILVNVDESDLLTDSERLNVRSNELKQVYEQLGLNEKKEKALRKKAMIFGFTGGSGSNEGFLDYEDCYHKKNQRHSNRVNLQKLNEVEIAHEIDVYVQNRKYLSVDYSEDVVGKERFNNEQNEDELLQEN